jgi:hypothetical protein
VSMETEDPFEAVEADPLTGAAPEATPPPTNEALPPGVEPGMLGGTDAPDPDALPIDDGVSEPVAAVEPAPEPDQEPINDGNDAPAEPPVEEEPVAAEEPVEAAEEPVPEPETPVERPGNNKQGGPPSRAYFIFERMEIEVGGEVVDAWVKRQFGNEDTIVARNGPNALRAAGRAIGSGFEGSLVPVPVSMWNPKPVSTKQDDNLRVSVG